MTLFVCFSAPLTLRTLDFGTGISIENSIGSRDARTENIDSNIKAYSFSVKHSILKGITS